MIHFITKTLLVIFALALLGQPQKGFAKDQATDTVFYKFKSGDTLNGFANRYLVNITAAAEVQRVNRIKNPAQMRPGTVISVPVTLLKGTAIGAKVIAFSGAVSIAGKNGKAEPTIGQIVSEGQILTTGAPGFLTITIAGGSNVSIPSRSRVKIVRLRKYLLTGGSDVDIFVEQGRAETAVSPIKDINSRFRMRTPTAVSAVRGTVFRIGYDGPGTSSLTEVVEGAVAIETEKSAKPALIPTGFGAALPISGTLLEEELLPSPLVTNAGAAQTNDSVKFNLSRVAGAKGYHTQIARDAGFLEIFAETVTTTPVAVFTTISDGSFFVRSRAIADSGLEGLSKSFGFRRRLAKINAAEVSSSVSGAFRIKWVSQSPGKAVYRFQLFDSSSNTTPMIDELGIETSGISLTNLPSGTYSWRVGMRQTTPEGAAETWSVPQNFTIGD